MTINPQRAQALYLAALETSDSEACRKLLERECANDAALRQRVEDMLAAHDATSGFDSARSNASVIATIKAPADPQPGSLVAGRYKLLETVGEGGMGSVWVAEQTVPVKRKVALKLIKAGMDSKAVLARFDAERQALALMDHPNIAKVLDAGTTESGRPYFAMELVKGTPITEFCDARRLSPRQRLELFVPVCQAIQHAHQKGIIHRDIKPSNVLVAMYDDRPVPKVIDFGVAKATGQSLTDQSVYTHIGAVVGTPEYMSPEQANINNLDIDTRSDVYSLGVLLYELLTGSTPVDRKSLGNAAVLEILRIVREVEAPRPSTKLSTAETLPNIAAARSIDPANLSKLLRGELDWVVMKALEKDRARRYDSANGLAADIQRYLADEVVEARPPSRSYLLMKYIRRNRLQVISASLVLLALVVGIVGTSLGMAEAIKARKAEAKRADAETRERERSVKAESQALEEKRIAQAVKDFLQNKLLAQADTTAQADALLKSGEATAEAKLNPTINELLDRAAKELSPDKIEASFPNQPLVQAEILQTVGEAYRGIGKASTAVDFLKRAESLFRQNLGPDHADTLNSMTKLAWGYMATRDTGLALPIFEETLELRKVILGPDHPDTLTSMNNLAWGYWDGWHRDKAEPIFEETLKLRKAKLGPEHLDTLNTMAGLSLAYRHAGKLDLAMPLFQETLELRKAKLGPDHPHTLHSMSNLGLGYYSAKKFDLALPIFEETLKIQLAKFGPYHPDTIINMLNLAGTYRVTGRPELAIPYYEKAVEGRKKILGPNHPDALLYLHYLAMIHRDLGQLDKAIQFQEQVYLGHKSFEVPGHNSTLNALMVLVGLHRLAGQDDKALNLLRELGTMLRETLPSESPVRDSYTGTLGFRLLEMHAYDDAEQILRDLLAIREKTLPDDWRRFNAQSLLGGAFLGQKKFADAEPLLLKGYDGMKAREKTMPPESASRLLVALERLIELYTNWHAAEPDKGFDAKAAEWQKKLDEHKAANAASK